MHLAFCDSDSGKRHPWVNSASGSHLFRQHRCTLQSLLRVGESGSPSFDFRTGTHIDLHVSFDKPTEGILRLQTQVINLKYMK